MLVCDNISVTYDGVVEAISKISFTLENSTITGIIGPNGAGKSSLLKAMLHVIPHSGTTLLDGSPAKGQLKKVAYVEQKSAIDFTFPIKVKECVSLGTYSSVGLFKKLGKRNWEDVYQALEMVGLKEYAERQISELSGGQFQRVLLARCLVQKTKFIFLDEPFVGIDSVSERIILQILRELKQEGKTILIVHHDLSKVSEYFDHLLIVNKKLIAAGETKQVFDKAHLEQAYGQMIF